MAAPDELLWLQMYMLRSRRVSAFAVVCALTSPRWMRAASSTRPCRFLAAPLPRRRPPHGPLPPRSKPPSVSRCRSLFLLQYLSDRQDGRSSLSVSTCSTVERICSCEKVGTDAQCPLHVCFFYSHVRTIEASL